MKTNIIKDALPICLANAVVAEFPNRDWRHWHKYDDKNSLKYASKDSIRFPSAIHRALQLLGSLVETSGINIWYPDTFVDYEFHAAGMHMMPSGGYIARHVDAMKHPIMPWRRTLSACLYVTPDWQDEWGGELVIGDEKMKPEFNTLAIFESNRIHEVMPVNGPESRRVLSLFCWEIDKTTTGYTQAKFESA